MLTIWKPEYASIPTGRKYEKSKSNILHQRKGEFNQKAYSDKGPSILEKRVHRVASKKEGNGRTYDSCGYY